MLAFFVMNKMSNKNTKGKIIIPAGCRPWPHELRVANILAMAGHSVEFIPKSNIKTADLYIDGIKFEVNSPRSVKTNSLEHILKKAQKQSCNVIIDASRIKSGNFNMSRFLTRQLRSRRGIKKLVLITKQGKIIDVNSLI